MGDDLERIQNLQIENIDLPKSLELPLTNNQYDQSIINKGVSTENLISDLEDKLKTATQQKEIKILQKRLDANNKLLDADLDESQLSNNDKLYLGNSKEVSDKLFNKKYSEINDFVNAANSIIPDTQNSTLTSSLNKAYDKISNKVMKVNPMAGTVMKAAGLLSDGLDALGLNTGQNTFQDKFFDSKFLKPIGVLNSVFGKRADTISKDEELFAQLGSGYTDSESDVDAASKLSGSKFGVLSNRARKKANRKIREANRQQDVMTDISDESYQNFLAQQSMSDIYANKSAFYSSGGFENRMSVGRQGMKIFSREQILKTKKLLQNPIRSLDQLVDYANKQNPNFIQRLHKKELDVIKLNDGSVGSHLLSYATIDDGRQLVFPKIQEINGELKLFDNDKDAIESAIKNKDYIILNNKEEAELFTKNYKTKYPIFNTLSYKNGGNLIPSGALHARLHHMDIDGITKKGIPVVVKKEDGEVEQQAEIEKNEIIFSLETTKKLENLYKRYYSDDENNKDQLAIEAGKFLVEEILYNTKDNTGLIKEV